MAVFLPRRWTRQPSGRIAINWAHPLIAGSDLRFFVTRVDGAFVDLVTGAFGTPNGSAALAGNLDTARGGSSVQAKLATATSDYYEFTHDASWNLTGDISLLWRGEIQNGSAIRHFAGKHAGGGGSNNPFDFRTDSSAAPKPVLVRSSAGGISINTTATQTVTVNRTSSVGVTCNENNNGGHNYYINGIVEAATASSGVPATADTSTLRIGRRADGAAQMDGYTEFVAGFATLMPADFFLAMYENPWQIMAPVSTRVYSVAAAGNSIAVPAASLVLTAQVPTVTQTGHQNIAVPAASLSLTAQTPTVTATANQVIDVPLAMLTLTALAPTITGIEAAQSAVGGGRRGIVGYRVEINGETYDFRTEQQAINALQTAHEIARKKIREREQKAKRAKVIVKPEPVTPPTIVVPDDSAALKAAAEETNRKIAVAYVQAQMRAEAIWQAFIEQEDEDEAISMLLH